MCIAGFFVSNMCLWHLMTMYWRLLLKTDFAPVLFCFLFRQIHWFQVQIPDLVPIPVMVPVQPTCRPSQTAETCLVSCSSHPSRFSNDHGLVLMIWVPVFGSHFNSRSLWFCRVLWYFWARGSCWALESGQPNLKMAQFFLFSLN